MEEIIRIDSYDYEKQKKKIINNFVEIFNFRDKASEISSRDSLNDISKNLFNFLVDLQKQLSDPSNPPEFLESLIRIQNYIKKNHNEDAYDYLPLLREDMIDAEKNLENKLTKLTINSLEDSFNDEFKMKEEDFKVFFDFIEDRFPSNSNFIRDEIIVAVDSMLSKTLKKSVFYFRFDVDIQISIKGIFEVLPIGEEEDSPLGFELEEGEYTLVEDYLIHNNPNFKSFDFSSDSYFSGSAICPLHEDEIIYFIYST